MQKIILFLTLALLFMGISCKKITIDDYKTAIVGEWVPQYKPNYAIYPPIEKHTFTFDDNKNYVDRKGECGSEEMYKQTRYILRHDTLIFLWQSGYDTAIISSISQHKMELKYLIKGIIPTEGLKLKKCN